MKKLAAILLTALLLFNWLGYRLFFGYMEQQSSHAMNLRLDSNDYDEASLISIKIPVTNLPYYTNSPIFERVKGNINIDGREYQYVEKRIYNDSLEMRCIPNQQITHISNARDAFFQLVNDLQKADSKPSPAKPAISLKNILPDFISTETRYTYIPVFTASMHSYLDFSDRLPVCFLSTPHRPPLAAAFS
ncbi:MAG TPA: hypothetical protein PLQ65_12050 [Flavihumibacter sp.]|nr:hypothetical protein [Flavihumibacter sp.]HQD10392.1 hypothetical protein [Flavihumibacter sp.]